MLAAAAVAAVAIAVLADVRRCRRRCCRPLLLCRAAAAAVPLPPSCRCRCLHRAAVELVLGCYLSLSTSTVNATRG